MRISLIRHAELKKTLIFVFFVLFVVKRLLLLLQSPDWSRYSGIRTSPTILFILTIHAYGGQALLKPDLTANERE